METDIELKKGEELANDVGQILRDAWSMEHQLRKEADMLAVEAKKDGKKGAYAAEQKRLILEKLMLLFIIVGLLEMAKRCLMGVIDRLTHAYNLLADATNALRVTLSSLADTVFQAINAAPPALGPVPPGTPPFMSPP